MRFLFYLLASLLSWSATSATLTLDGKSLEDESSKGLFFDAHNHNGGVVPPLGIVNAEKFIYGEPLELRELKNFWSAFVNSDIVKENVLTNSMFTNGIKMLITCNEPMNFCSRLVNTQECEKKLIDGISHLLSATPLTGFSTAYGIRRNLVDIPDLPGKTTSDMRTHALLFELAKTKVDVVEMSRPSMGGYGEEGSTWDFERYAQVTDDLRLPEPSENNRRFKSRLTELGLAVPRIKWLLMTHTTEMGTVADNQTATYAEGQCSLVPLPDSLKTDPMTGLYSVLLNYHDVVGVDVAGPETTCFTKEGMERFKGLAEATYFASQAKQREKRYLGKMVVRAHVGEGYPLTDQPFHKEEMASCNAIKTFPEIKYVFDRTQQVPVHRIEAQKNIAFVLDAIQDLRNKYSDLNEYVIFRLAHLTHMDEPLAKRAKELGVTADVNLSSNAATGAWTINPELIDRYITKNGLTPETTPDLLNTLVEKGASLGEIFDNHGLKWLLFHHVPVTLGSDGSGVEHSASLRKEYLMAKELIDYWNKNDAEFAKKNVTIDELLLNQKAHYQAMGYSLAKE